MGFTRYWTRPRELASDRFSAYADACEFRCASLEIDLHDKRFTADFIAFEGMPGCEPFLIARVSQGRERNGQITEYCKTQGLPYDTAVQACLVLLKEHYPEVEIHEPS